jgi:hypothetical protein
VFPNSLTLFVFSFLLAAVWPAPKAFAYENLLTVGGNLGFAERIADEGPRHGGMFGISSSIGLDDIWTARGRFSYSVHHASDLLQAFFLSAEILYLIDILEFVPYLGGGPDGVATLWNDQFKIDFALHAVVGVDYLFSREVIFGLEVRPLFFLTRTGTQLAYLSVVFAASYSFEM